MSEIPIGSPPAPPGRHAAPTGWYPDPLDAARERYWDGWQWSSQTREGSGVRPGHTAAWRNPGQRPSGATGKGIWWRRVGATVIDVVVVQLASMLVCWSVLSSIAARIDDWMVANAGTQPMPMPDAAQFITVEEQLILTGVTVGLSLAYGIWLLRTRSATWGQRIFGLRVIAKPRWLRPGAPEPKPTDKLGWGTVIHRSILWTLLVNGGAVIWVLFLYSVLRPLWDKDGQAFHDTLSGTAVVAANAEARPAASELPSRLG